ncbi:MAG: hypothetical protein JO283_05725 [Bradyrhizobium sp.]|nr:hypothetical protein [Bradyrhizobium sp.]
MIWDVRRRAVRGLRHRPSCSCCPFRLGIVGQTQKLELLNDDQCRPSLMAALPSTTKKPRQAEEIEQTSQIDASLANDRAERPWKPAELSATVKSHHDTEQPIPLQHS